MNEVTLALPSKGAIAQPTQDFLKDCGMRIEKPNPRQYTGKMPIFPHVNVLFQRVKDVAYKVADGTAQLGVTGYDVVCEYPHDDLIVIHDRLDYGHCKLIVAVPEAWVDVSNMIDLSDIALDFRQGKLRNLRIATTYPNLTRQFMHQQGIHHFSLVKAEGAIEAAPTIGYADIIVDLTQTGTTLRENHLKMLADGVIVESQACLVGHRPALQQHPELLDTVRMMLEYIDAAQMGQRYTQVTVNMCGQNAAEIGQALLSNPLTHGLQGPTIAPIYQAKQDDQKQWHSVTITVERRNLMPAVEYLRSIGGRQVVTVPAKYLFFAETQSYLALLSKLEMSD